MRHVTTGTGGCAGSPVPCLPIIKCPGDVDAPRGMDREVSPVSAASSQEAPATAADQAAMRVVGYVRVSTDEQGVSGLGLEAQRAAIAAECRRRGWELARFEADVAGGAKLDRPGLNAAVDA